MSPARRLLVPVAVGALAAGATFGAITIGGDDDAPSGSVVAGARTTPTRAHEEGRAVFARMGCGSCHRLAAAGSTGTIGPNLDDRLAGYTAGSLAERIVRPPSDGGSFSAMPDDFGERMSDADLDALVAFLLATRDSR
jgi:cytochrome c551/c552